MEYIVLLAVLFLIVIAKCLYDNFGFEKRWKENLWQAYGKFQDTEKAGEYYSEEKLWKIGYYSRSLEGSIDDITWNDLGMDSVFAYINQTGSFAGEEYLYAILRHLELSEDKLIEREKILKFYKDCPEGRMELRKLFARVGKTKRLSFYGGLLKCDIFQFKSSLKYVMFSLSLIIAVLILFLGDFIGIPIGVGILCVIITASNNIYQYYKRKAEIEPYYDVVSNTLSLLYLTEKFIGLKIPEDIFGSYKERLRELKKGFGRFKRGVGIVMSGREGGGGIEDIILDYVRMLFHIDLIKFNSMMEMLNGNREGITEIFEILGMLDSMYAIASFREYKKVYTQPEFTGAKKELSFSELYHPLISEPVPNSLEAKGSILMTGSNASGKSTFLKTVGVNVILAQSVNTVLAKSYRAGMFRVYSSMALSDNLLDGESYYIVEIKSLLRIIKQAQTEDKAPVLCFIDEVLRGTNTVERIGASSKVLEYLGGKNALCFAATHDIELTKILEGSYSNFHFEERVETGEDGCSVIFDYKLRSGPARTRNAILLLESLGYDRELTGKIREAVERFERTGEW